MSENWQPGDLALCVNGERPAPGSCGDTPTHFMVGGIYHVINVVHWDVLGLVIENHPNRHPSNAWRADCFRKIPPRAADEFDRETIALLTGKPVKEPVHAEYPGATPCCPSAPETAPADDSNSSAGDFAPTGTGVAGGGVELCHIGTNT